MASRNSIKGEISRVPGIEATHITALYETEDGVLWVGTRSSGVFRYSGGDIQNIDIASGLPENDVTAIEGTRHGGLWIATRESGIIHYHGGHLYPVDIEHGLSSNRILSLYEDRIGSLWIGTDQHGIARLRLDCPGHGSREQGHRCQNQASVALAAMQRRLL